MEKLQFDKIVSLHIIPEDKIVIINGLELYLVDEKLYKKAWLTIQQAKEIEAKYKVEGQEYSPEDRINIQEDVQAQEFENKKEISLFIGDKNAVDLILDLNAR